MLALGVSDETYEEATEASQTRFENLVELLTDIYSRNRSE